MKITIYGTGYVGLVTGVCFAEVGNDVLCMDVDQAKIEALLRGEMPIYEPDLEAMVLRNIRAGRLIFGSDVKAAVDHGVVQFIAVGTPPDETGSADLSYVLSVAEGIARNMDEYRLLVTKSTVPVGTADRVNDAVGRILIDRGEAEDYDVVANPEFLKEGAAIADFMKPDRVVIGASSSRAVAILRELYAPFNRNHDRIMAMDTRSAELTKYAANGMLATKISFMNEMANIAEHLGADIEMVRQGIGSDQRIGYSFIYAGCGYGGSCFPKDVNAVYRSALNAGYQPKILQAVEEVNQAQKNRLFEKITAYFGDQLAGKTIALWGLSFKPNTDDMREAPSRHLLEALWQAGARVRAYDPVAMPEAVRIFGQREDFYLTESPLDAVSKADALVVVTEWQVFRSPDFAAIKASLSTPVIFDGRNIYDPEALAAEGFSYCGIGRRSSALQ